MVKDLDDLGTPSAPPFMDIAREGKMFSIESKEGKVSRFTSEIEQRGNEACTPEESDGSCQIKEGLSDGRTQSPKTSELGEWYYNSYLHLSSLQKNKCLS